MATIKRTCLFSAPFIAFAASLTSYTIVSPNSITNFAQLQFHSKKSCRRITNDKKKIETASCGYFINQNRFTSRNVSYLNSRPYSRKFIVSNALPPYIDSDSHAYDDETIKTDEEKDRTYDGFGPLIPIAEKLDDVTGNWALSYADLSPETPKTPAGILFLVTNIFYAISGIGLALHGDVVFGALTEVAGIVSFWYHYTQLELGKDRKEVRLTLLIDYLTAGSALIYGTVYLAQLGISATSPEMLASGAISIACLSLCWVWEYGYPYLFWHSLWHITSAYTGFMVGQAHIDMPQ
mmetsp:Transcript_21615/g.30283  ORF Transcript_21615/g.30283 Transcript_21615/m.30283 type:complete len:294 (+) Transcript_21615:15-896(+)